MLDRLILFGSETGIAALGVPLQQACPSGWTMASDIVEDTRLLELSNLSGANSVLCFATEDVLWSLDLDQCASAMDRVRRIKSETQCKVLAVRIDHEFQRGFTAANGTIDAYAAIDAGRSVLRDLIERLGKLE